MGMASTAMAAPVFVSKFLKWLIFAESKVDLTLYLTNYMLLV